MILSMPQFLITSSHIYQKVRMLPYVSCMSSFYCIIIIDCKILFQPPIPTLCDHFSPYITFLDFQVSDAGSSLGIDFNICLHASV